MLQCLCERVLLSTVEPTVGHAVETIVIKQMDMRFATVDCHELLDVNGVSRQSTVMKGDASEQGRT